MFAVLIARPIRQLDQAIRRMGTADFTHAIEVNGPQDLRYLGQRLEWLRTRLNELEQQQTRFLRHVSHELKTPLTAVREGAELLRDNVGGRLSPEQQEIVRIVRENTLSLQKLIEDLLTYHQTRAVEPATLGPVPVADVVRRVLREQKLAAIARMITFDARLASCDRRRRRGEDPHGHRQPGVQRDQVLAALRRHRAGGSSSATASRCSTWSTTGRASPPTSASACSTPSTRARRRSTARSRAPGSASRSRANTRSRRRGASRSSIARTAKRGVRFRLWLPLAAGASALGATKRVARRRPRSPEVTSERARVPARLALRVRGAVARRRAPRPCPRRWS